LSPVVVVQADAYNVKIKPVFSMEYEYAFTMPELAQCVEYFDRAAADLAGE